MAKFLGVDIAAGHVRAVLVGTRYRRIALEATMEVNRADVADLKQAIQLCALPLMAHCDGIAVAVDGQSAFFHPLNVPATVSRQLAAVIPFEIEAQLPIGLDEVVYDYLVLPRQAGSGGLRVLTASARTTLVQERILAVHAALGRDPERVGCGALPLANLASLVPALRAAAPVAVVDLGAEQTEVVILEGGVPIFARTLGIGVAGLPASAAQLAAGLRQTFAAAGARSGSAVELVFLVGAGASAPGADAYLSVELGAQVLPLPPPELDGLTPEQQESLPRFAKALALAAGVAGRGRDLDLRRGGLSFQQSYAFLKDKLPVLSGLGATLLVSFVFSACAELEVLSQETVVLDKALTALSAKALGEETDDPERVLELLDSAPAAKESDPMPHADGYDVMLGFTQAVPESVVHDIEELDYASHRVRIRGVVGSTTEAQKIADAMKHRCFRNVKLAKVAQVVNSERQKYDLELEVRCPEDDTGKKKSSGKREEG